METLFSYFQPKGEIKLFKNDRSPSGKKPHSDLEKADSKHLNEQGVKKSSLMSSHWRGLK